LWVWFLDHAVCGLCLWRAVRDGFLLSHDFLYESATLIIQDYSTVGMLLLLLGHYT